MPTNIYCTYITVYTGNKLPPFYILTRHETRQEAQDKEIIFHEAFSVASNPMYINMAHANGKFFTSGPRSPETKAKISAAKTGKKHTPETIAKMSGKKQSPEHITNNAAAKIGKKQSPETIAKRVAANTGKKRSPEAIAKTAAANTGQKRGPYKKKS